MGGWDGANNAGDGDEQAGDENEKADYKNIEALFKKAEAGGSGKGAALGAGETVPVMGEDFPVLVVLHSSCISFLGNAHKPTKTAIRAIGKEKISNFSDTSIAKATVI